MGVAIGGRHTVMWGTTIPTRRHTVAGITAVMVIIMERLTMTPPQELTAGSRLPMALTDRRHAALPTILIQVLMLGVLRCRHLMGPEVRHRPITRILGPMLRPDKVRVRMRSGAAPTCRAET